MATISASAARYWKHGNECPLGRSFGEALEWHLVHWGTRKGCNKRKGDPWIIWRFAAKIYGKVLKADSRYDEFDTETNRVKRWRQGLSSLEDDDVKTRILDLLFGDDDELADWRHDLEIAFNRPIEKAPRLGKVSRTMDSLHDGHAAPDTALSTVLPTPLGPLDQRGWEALPGGADTKRYPTLFHQVIPTGSKTYCAEMRTKIDFLKYNVSPARLAELGVSQDKWLARFDPESLAAAWGYEVKTLPTASIAALVDQRLNGERTMKPRERAELAEHLLLNTAGLDLKSAADLFAEDLPFDRFTDDLIGAGWATKALAESGRFKSLHLLLRAFAPFSLHAGGLLVGDDAGLSAGQRSEQRGTGVPLLSDAAPRQSFALDTEISLIVENLAEIRGLVLLEIGPQNEGGYHSIRSLVPSVLAPLCQVTPGQILPTNPVHGVARYITREPTGRYDWLAILTFEPLSPIWHRTSGDMHHLSEMELEWLLDALDEQMCNHETAAALEVRHHAFKIVA